ncbi:MAG TPA: acyl-CoA dehydrogenase family protein [bacterium]|nr:acyl-CoA dehydrogenase family protein [bacterium]
MIADGYLRLCIPESVGGDGRSLVDTALVYEELYTENASVALTLMS